MTEFGIDGGTGRSFRAPGRVNLIGDHTDYNEGLVLPMAIDLECVVRAHRRRDGMVRVRSLDVEGGGDLAADGSLDPDSAAGWVRYAAGVVRALAERGRPPVGIDAVVSSTVPVGSGLSSSAALEVSLALALCDAADFVLSPLDLALACQQAEREATGVPCGLMDQLSSIYGREGSALLIDCRTNVVEPVALPADLAVLVVHSGLPRALADSAYAERRGACEHIASSLGLRSLRDAAPAQVRDEPLARHVVSENARVVEAAAALAAGDVVRLGQLLTDSHRSLRDDFQVSTPELDLLVDALVRAGAFGARLTGAGFGGCVVGVTAQQGVAGVSARARRAYEAETGISPMAYTCHAAAGAAMVP